MRFTVGEAFIIVDILPLIIAAVATLVIQRIIEKKKNGKENKKD